MIFTFFILHLSRTCSKNMWSHMVISQHLLTLFAIKYIHIPDALNHVYMSSHVKEKYVSVSMRTLYIQEINVKVWTHINKIRQGIIHVP